MKNRLFIDHIIKQIKSITPARRRGYRYVPLTETVFNYDFASLVVAPDNGAAVVSYVLPAAVQPIHSRYSRRNLAGVGYI